MKNSIIVNFQTAKSVFSDSELPTVIYDIVSHTDQNSYSYSITAKTLVYSSIDTKRGIHYAEITELQENTSNKIV
jgi:hypothetical protein